MALAVLVEVAHRTFEGALGVYCGDVLPVEFADAAAKGAKPQVARAVFDHGDDAVVGQPVVAAEIGKLRFVKATGAVAVGAKPDVAVAVFGQGVDLVVGQPVFDGKVVEFFAVVAAGAVGWVAKPDMAVAPL